MRLVQQLVGVVQAAAEVQAGVFRRVLVDVLAIFHGGDLGVVDGAVDLDDGHVFLRADGGVARTVLQVPAGVAQVGERVQVGGVVHRRRRRGRRGDDAAGRGEDDGTGDEREEARGELHGDSIGGVYWLTTGL